MDFLIEKIRQCEPYFAAPLLPSFYHFCRAGLGGAARVFHGAMWGIPPPRGTGRPSLLSSSTSSSSPQKHTGRAFAGRHRKVSCFHRKWNLNGNQPMESGDPRVDGERVFPQVLLQVIHPAFPVTGFFSFPSLYETSLNDHEPSIANDFRKTHTK